MVRMTLFFLHIFCNFTDFIVLAHIKVIEGLVGGYSVFTNFTENECSFKLFSAREFGDCHI